MDRAQLLLNAKRFLPAFLGFVVASLHLQTKFKRDLIEKDVFGIDGKLRATFRNFIYIPKYIIKFQEMEGICLKLQPILPTMRLQS